MTVKLIRLKSGEDVIADVSEMYRDETSLIGYLFKRPCVAYLHALCEDVDGKTGHKIELTSWMPLPLGTNVSAARYSLANSARHGSPT
mgnify:CR=1 FL=1